MNKTTLEAVIPGVIASAAILLSLAVPLNAGIVIGFGAVIAVLGIAAMEYGTRTKRSL